MKNKKTGVTRRAFMYFSGLTALALGKNVAAHESTSQSGTNSAADEWSEMLKEINDFPLFKALFNRRSRRFGWGMEIPHGPLQYKSTLPASPIDDFERAVILAAGLGASGWHHGISVKSHGNASPYAFSCAMNNCFHFISNDLNKKIIDNFKS